MQPNDLETQKFELHKSQYNLQKIQVLLSMVLIFFIIKNSMKKENLPDSIIEDEEE
jgi:hypothetical protein